MDAQQSGTPEVEDINLLVKRLDKALESCNVLAESLSETVHKFNTLTYEVVTILGIARRLKEAEKE